ncbi:isochorismate synthase [Thiocystis violacea]|uniref:isochorismate synthase n=1 Tax=Thiocystis violacea TaxID=13725 RepID=UPI001905BBAF|nr:isochorismate synthase [Thiocystis violacea]MBK1716282.1 isochorismate synthase [Thiocystis violacea]
MLQPLHVLEQLKARLRETFGNLPLDQRAGPVSLILELPHGLANAPDLPGPRFHFGHNHRGDLRAGYGIAGEWRSQGPERLQRLRAIARTLSADWRQYDPDETGFSGFGMLGFAASPNPAPNAEAEPLPNALFWVPELALTSHAGQAALVLTTRGPTDRDALLARWEGWLDRVVPLLDQPALDPLTPAHLEPGDSTPGLDDWRELVFAALDEIDSERIEKVVVCRRLRLQGHRRFDLTRLNAALSYLFPSCQVINIRRYAASFVAATPERLFTQRRDRVEADAIAGTACRAEDADRDAAITRGLQTCEKNLREHRVVAEAVTEALSHCCRHLEPPDGPRILQLNNAQHLWSLVRGELNPGVDVFELAERLHPTPATNGQPRREARAWLHANEPIERGWYTGAAGIVEPDLTGELWVLLRCARILDRTADLYAGAGIVAGSDPMSEWRETEHKLAAMSTALQFA